MKDAASTDEHHEPVLPFDDFRQAASAVLSLLHADLGFGLWLLTRTEGDDWIVLDAEDHAYGVEEGDVFRWSDSFCSRMVRGLGPRIAPRSSEVPAYVEAPIGRQVAIGAYVGVPLSRRDGSLFGTLCAIDPHPQPESVTAHLPLVEVYARLLATILDSEIGRLEQKRRAERAEMESETDPLTGLFNRRGWERLRDYEEERCRRYGHPAAIVLIDLDGLKKTNDEEGHDAGDRLLRQMGSALRSAVRKSDVVARLGGDEFGVLAVEESPAGLERLVERIRDALCAHSIAASIGYAARHPKGSLEAAQALADDHMYAHKRRPRPDG